MMHEIGLLRSEVSNLREITLCCYYGSEFPIESQFEKVEASEKVETVLSLSESLFPSSVLVVAG